MKNLSSSIYKRFENTQASPKIGPSRILFPGDGNIEVKKPRLFHPANHNIFGKDIRQNRLKHDFFTGPIYSLLNPDTISSEIKRLNRFIVDGPTEDFTTIEANITYFPLRFNHVDYEKKFTLSIEQNMRARLWLASAGSFIAYLVFLLIMQVSNLRRWCAILPDLFNVLLVIFIVSIQGFYMYLLFKDRKPLNEGLFHKFFIFTDIGIASIMVAVGISLSNDGNEGMLTHKMEPTKVMFNNLIFFVSSFNTGLIDVVFRTRTCASFFTHLLNLAIFALAEITFSFLIITKDPQIIRFIVVSSINQILNLGCVVGLFFLGRWFIELQERIVFLRGILVAKKLSKLKDISSSKTYGQSTALPSLLLLLEKASENVGIISAKSKAPKLIYAKYLLRKCEKILTNTRKKDLETAKIVSSQTIMNENTKHVVLLYSENFFATAFSSKIQKIMINSRLKGSEPVVAYKHLSASTINIFSHIGREWDVDLLQLSGIVQNILVEVGYILLCDRVYAINSTRESLMTFLTNLELVYPKNPFHNSTHAATVAHTLHCLLYKLRIFNSDLYSTLDHIAIFIAALGHDAGHPGRTNKHIRDMSDLSLLYPETSLIQNMASSITFKCLDNPFGNFLAKLSYEDYFKVRKKIIEYILLFDMSQFNESLLRLGILVASEMNYLDIEDNMCQVINLCIMCSDFSYTASDWSQNYQWCLRLAEERYQQGDVEKRENYPSSWIYNRDYEYHLPLYELVFLKSVASPSYFLLKSIQYGYRISGSCIYNLMNNKRIWNEMINAQSYAGIPAIISEMKTNPDISFDILVSLYRNAPSFKASQF